MRTLFSVIIIYVFTMSSDFHGSFKIYEPIDMRLANRVGKWLNEQETPAKTAETAQYKLFYL